MIQKPREIRDLYLRKRGDQSRITVVQVSTPTNLNGMNKDINNLEERVSTQIWGNEGLINNLM